MAIKGPASLAAEHDELHKELLPLTKIPGKIGEAAKAVAAALHPHFVKEEEYAVPPLGLLPALAQGRITPEMKSALEMTERLKRDLPEMLAEHKAIVLALDHLTSVAKAEGQPQYARFAEKLALHARTEEEVLYPAAILVGEYLKLKLKQ